MGTYKLVWKPTMAIQHISCFKLSTLDTPVATSFKLVDNTNVTLSLLVVKNNINLEILNTEVRASVISYNFSKNRLAPKMTKVEVKVLMVNVYNLNYSFMFAVPRLMKLVAYNCLLVPTFLHISQVMMDFLSMKKLKTT